MRIIFIGTGHGLLEPHRRWSCTMLEIGGKYYFVDMGTNAMEDARRMGIAPGDIKAIFLTHAHGDHGNGLASVVYDYNLHYPNTELKVLVPHARVISALETWFQAMYSPDGVLREGIECSVIEDGEIYNDGTLKVTAVGTKHWPDSHAFIMEAEGKKFLFTGDLKNPAIDFPALDPDEEYAFAVCEATHFPVTDYLPVFEKLNIKRVLFNHISPARDAELFTLRNMEHRFIMTEVSDGMVIAL